MALPTRHRPAPSADPVLPPMPSTIDLHAHSRRSDGVLEPRELVHAAWAVGVRHLALTDHDSLAGYRELAAAGLPDGFELIPAVELNSIVGAHAAVWGAEMHLLGFGVDPHNEAFEATLVRQRAQRRSRFLATVKRLRELGLPIDAQVAHLNLAEADALGRPTIGRALVEAGLAESVEDSFVRLLGRGRPAHIDRTGLGPLEAIAAIRKAGGVAVLAHYIEAPTRIRDFPELIEAGLRGLEVYYRRFDAPTTAALARVARTLGLLATGGSDYHGDDGSYAEIHARLWVPGEVLAPLKAAYKG